MSGTPSSKFLGIGDSSSAGFLIKNSGVYEPQSANNGSSPLLALPQYFAGYAWTGFTRGVGSKAVAVTAVDQFLTEYCREYLQTYFTIRFIELANEKVVPFGFSKLEYAVNLYLNICNLPETTETTEPRKVLAYYFNTSSFTSDIFNIGNLPNLDNIFASTNQARLEALKSALKPTEKKYLDKLVQTNFPLAKTTFKFNADEAQGLIEKANLEMDHDLTYYFATAKMKMAMFNADAIINDERFRPSLFDPRWNEYDETIKREVAFYNKKFAGIAGFTPLDWRYVKAMVWTEVLAGPAGNSKQWTTYPMQIGRFAQDQGYVVVRDGKTSEGADLVTTEELREAMKDKSKVIGQLNVRAGIAYLYIRAIGRVASEDQVTEPTILKDAVKKGDTGLDAIAKRLGTTTGNLLANNPGLTTKTVLKIGQELNYQKAISVRYIASWKDWTTTINNYNGGGDAKYQSKVERAYQIIISRTPQ